jgi:hypothetical protein
MVVACKICGMNFDSDLELGAHLEEKHFAEEFKRIEHKIYRSLHGTYDESLHPDNIHAFDSFLITQVKLKHFINYGCISKVISYYKDMLQHYIDAKPQNTLRVADLPLFDDFLERNMDVNDNFRKKLIAVHKKVIEANSSKFKKA